VFCDKGIQPLSSIDLSFAHTALVLPRGDNTLWFYLVGEMPNGFLDLNEVIE
jgi:hypothetical protein